MSATADLSPSFFHKFSSVLRFTQKFRPWKNVTQPATIDLPTSSTVIDLTKLKDEKLNLEIHALISELFPTWMNGQYLEIKRVSGALTNAVFFVTAGSKRLLLRVYGIGCDDIVDRTKEIQWLIRLANLKLGPKLLGLFGNGRFEEYLDATTLTSHDIRDKPTSAAIAYRLSQLHSITSIYPNTKEESWEVWLMVDKWYHMLSTHLNHELSSKSASWAKILKEVDVARLGREIEECKTLLNSMKNKVVFAHNDTQYGNILKTNNTGELIVIDFEYSGYNPRGFDIANHFCEWMYDYHSDEPSLMVASHYPTQEEQAHFLKAYAKHANPKNLQQEVSAWTMACHLTWALWGFVQANQSEIDFDYFFYAIQRVQAFRKCLEEKKNAF